MMWLPIAGAVSGFGFGYWIAESVRAFMYNSHFAWGNGPTYGFIFMGISIAFGIIAYFNLQMARKVDRNGR